MNEFTLLPIGRITAKEGRFGIEIDEEWREGLTGLEGFTWINVIWWPHMLDNPEARSILSADKPYRRGPEKLGIFATRSPARPNPVLVTPVMVGRVNAAEGVIEIPYIDAEDDSPVLDIKPYHGSTDRVDNWGVPDWCADWPKSIEASACFDWEEVFNF